MKKTTLIAVAVLLAAFGLQAGTHSGVSMADKVAVDGKNLVLNGMGLRTKFMVKVYVAGLYLESPGHNAAAILASDTARRVEMSMMRDLGKGKISEAVIEGFEKNSGPKMGALKARLDRFVAAIPDLKENDRLVITYAPGKGTTLTSSRGQAVTIEGKDFADALFSVWLGQKPVDETLKKGMLAVS